MSAKDAKKKPKPVLSPMVPDTEAIRDVSVLVYKARLSAKDLADVLRDPEKGEPWVRRNAGAWDTLTRAYMQALGVPMPMVKRP